jgi:Holliday junction resolvase
MSGKTSRTKGHSFEREIAKTLKDEGIFPDACRQLEYQENQCNGVDLANTGKLRIQCKRMKSSVPISKIEEIKSDGIHCLVSKTDRKPTYITLKFEDFLQIIKDIQTVYEN